MSKEKFFKVSVEGCHKIYDRPDGIDLYFIIISIDGEYKTGWSTRRPFTNVTLGGVCGFSDMIAQIDISEEPIAEYKLY